MMSDKRMRQKEAIKVRTSLYLAVLGAQAGNDTSKTLLFLCSKYIYLTRVPYALNAFSRINANHFE